MSDTQWPLYEVFHQDRPGKPHYSVGAVHAPDPEMALQNGRDVFVRRPNCHSLWVAPTEAIFTKTAEEMAEDPSWENEVIDPAAPVETYYVFQKLSQRRSMEFVFHVGEVEARSVVEAMKKAVERFTDDSPFVWWVCPESALTQSDEEDIESMFAPAKEKKYRMPNQYRTVVAMQTIKRDQTNES